MEPRPIAAAEDRTAGRSDRAAIEGRVLGVVAGLVDELGGLPAGRAPALDDSLDRDLGLGSLERVELWYGSSARAAPGSRTRS
jgi:hypothetical protein